MLAEIAAANAAFSVIKQFLMNGKELVDCADIGGSGHCCRLCLVCPTH